MSIRKIVGNNHQYGMDRLRLIGLSIKEEGGKSLLSPEGLWIAPANPEGEVYLTLKKGVSHSVTLPHIINVTRNAILVSIAPEIAVLCNSISFPSLLSSGFEGNITVNLRPREDVIINNEFIKLSVLEVAP